MGMLQAKLRHVLGTLCPQIRHTPIFRKKNSENAKKVLDIKRIFMYNIINQRTESKNMEEHTMKSTYTIPTDRRENIEKLVVRYQKKAAKYGIGLTVEYGEPYATRVPVYMADPVTHVLYEKDKVLVEVFDLTIDGDEIRKDGYTVIAKIEHLEGGNVISTFGEEIKPAWREATGRCEHCGRNSHRRLTFIVRHEDGTEKQVGRSCLKDYCGIDPQAIGYCNELTEILLNDDIDHQDFNECPASKAYDTITALALAIATNKRQGYVKSGEPNANKDKLAAEIKGYRPTEAEQREAEEMANAIAAINEDDAFASNLNNVQSIIRSGYCKDNHFGYIAYAPVAYERYIVVLKRRAERDAEKDMEKQSSAYVGEVGKRIDIDVADMKLVTSWESQWGMTFLYKFTDTNGNVFVWFASKPFERVNADGIIEDVTNVSRIKATVKDHTEREGVKQTIITRCKAA